MYRQNYLKNISNLKVVTDLTRIQLDVRNELMRRYT